MTPPAAAAAAQGMAAAGADDASDVDLAPVSKKGLADTALPLVICRLLLNTFV